VPQEAVIATGKRSVVIVREDGRFRPVDVAVGRDLGDNVEIKTGLREGETVVASGQFLLYSESSLKAALPRLDAGTPGAGRP
jgi:Cu(I)/Ag(I) efflux system membrane fusion protein